jgi:hypothetical protein
LAVDEELPDSGRAIANAPRDPDVLRSRSLAPPGFERAGARPDAGLSEALGDFLSRQELDASHKRLPILYAF